MNTMIDRCTKTGTAVFFYALKLGMREVGVQRELMERQQWQSIMTARKKIKKFLCFLGSFSSQNEGCKNRQFYKVLVAFRWLAPVSGKLFFPLKSILGRYLEHNGA